MSVTPQSLQRARELRQNMTEQERRLWYNFLRHYPVKVYKQKAFENYIVDFCCPSAKLIIELDGSQHFEPGEQAYDQRRTAFLQSLGYQVVRYTNLEINRQFRHVCEDIHSRITSRLPSSIPRPIEEICHRR